MVYFIRILLIFLIIFLVVRSFLRAGSSGSNVSDPHRDKDSGDNKKKGVPKGIGEYIDFEEVKEK